MMLCPKCKLKYEDKFLFCRQCGSKLQEIIEQNFCPFCGNKIETNGDFCPYCSNSLAETNTNSVVNGINLSTDKFVNTIGKSVRPVHTVEHDATEQNQFCCEMKDSDEPFFSKRHLFSCEGRRGRLSFIKVLFFWWIISETFFFLYSGNFTVLVLFGLLLAYPQFCNLAKRFHDFNLSTSWAFAFYMVVFLLSIGIHATHSLAMLEKSVLSVRLLIAGFFIIPCCLLCFKKGTTGTNKFGSDPVSVSNKLETKRNDFSIKKTAMIALTAILILLGLLNSKAHENEAFMVRLFDAGITIFLDGQELYSHAYKLEREGNYNEAFKWYKSSAELGYVRAQNKLAVLYDEGIGVNKNKQEAFKWFLKAAEQGDVDAQYNVANCYLNGSGVDKNIEKAEKWFIEAAKMGDVGAMTKLEKMNPNKPSPWLKNK